MHTPCRLDKTPLSDRVSSTFLNKADKPSAHNKYKYGESRSPCFMPLVGVMKPFGSPLIRTECIGILSIFNGFKLVYILNLLLSSYIYYKFFELVGICPNTINRILIPTLFLVLMEVGSISKVCITQSLANLLNKIL